jgi:hypothetical protein
MATIEPVFSHIEDVMAYRRASSRHPTTIVAEVLMKVLARPRPTRTYSGRPSETAAGGSA